MKENKKKLYKIIYCLEVILFVGIIVLLKLIPPTLNSLFVFITLFVCKILIDNLINRIFAKSNNYIEIMNTMKLNIKSTKRYYVICIIVLVIVFSYYIISIINYYSLTSKRLINNVLPQNCQIELINEKDDSKYYESNSNKCHLNIIFIESSNKRTDIYNTYINNVINNYQPINNSEKITSWDGIEWSSTGKTYTVIYQKRNTIVYINSHIKYKNEVKEIMKKIGYTSESTSKHIFN